jgi:hypothetical protein
MRSAYSVVLAIDRVAAAAYTLPRRATTLSRGELLEFGVDTSAQIVSDSQWARSCWYKVG